MQKVNICFLIELLPSSTGMTPFYNYYPYPCRYTKLHPVQPSTLASQTGAQNTAADAG